MKFYMDMCAEIDFPLTTISAINTSKQYKASSSDTGYFFFL